ncbi:uncharacterized protein A1O9_07563 [Exophiala aquamarina CBS 119918]|uniref:Pre-mRNA splicing factor CLF1 n=1 Tax=Exophiala aquamarina CBS 119918 TaxID=1182545 RepID=A0A072P9M4_9EURO|nr:uncharacterized protein A1O9_07563 [Exophiala aquamarina CBS 119918]KEF55983.1 hypothetical protein A1O9_07563 [Exophiala aquamarina CBS 119918]
MSSSQLPVTFKNQCSIVHNGVVYVYSPDAFQTLELKEGAKWKEEPNGVSVTGAVCVKGGVDGDNSRPALYVVGGIANDASADYSGLQRFSIDDKSWKTIALTAPVTQHRHNHGAAYMTASSSIVVYSGAQDSYDGASSETFLLQTYPPYDVLAYSSQAPPTIKPFMLPWNDDRALLVGGGDTNTNAFLFDPTGGWQDLGLVLPSALPDPAIAQSALFTLDDNSKILQTFQLGSSPPTVMTNVLLNPGGQPASFNETVGDAEQPAVPSETPGTSGKIKRATFLNNYPVYNGTLAPSATRTGFSLAQGEGGLIAFVGGNDDNPISFFNQSENAWVSNAKLLGTQEPLTTPSSSRTSTIPTPTASSVPTTTPTAASSSSSKSRGLTVLGAVLGGICGLAAILIILLLWLRSVRRKRAHAERQSEYPDDKRRSGDYSFEERGLQPLSKAGQPMGRSPVPSAVISDADSTAMFGSKPDPKYLIRRVSSDRNQPGFRGSGIAFGQALFKRDKSAQLSISKPMNPILGDFKERPSIDLGAATPAAAVPAAATRLAAATAPARKPSQRKTDEGWGKYFQKEPPTGNRTTFLSRSSASKSGFWPGTGVPEPQLRPPKIILRDSIGNPLEAHSVAAGSPSFEYGPPSAQSRGLQAAQGIPARISSASSVTTNSTDDDYEDDHVDGAFSSGVPASVNNVSWTPVGNTWSGPAERPLRPPSSYVAALGQARPLNTASSNDTNNTSDTKTSSIPSFPMPNSLRSVQASGANATAEAANIRSVVHSPNITGDYFGNFGDANEGPKGNDMSWLNLGTPNR